MLHAFLTYINEQKLFNSTDKILLTVSGGKDSMTMLDLFCQANTYNQSFEFAVAHCNFQLRGQDSEEDKIFVEQLCKTKNIEFYSKKFETKVFSEANHISIEMAARKLRYEWFETLRKELEYDFIATAHHLNDSIETVLLNLTKGTGISGLKGILSKKERIIRPLLFASRQEIDRYAAENKLTWREDSSNASNEYQRNLIRNQVVPLLKQINPNFDETFARNLDRFQAIENDFRKNLVNFKQQIIREENGILYLKISAIKHWQSAHYYLEELLKEFGFNYFQSKEIYQSIDGLSGKIFLSGTHTLLKDREELVIKILENDVKEEHTIIIKDSDKIVKFEGGNLEISIIDISEISTNFDKNNTTLFVDFDKISFPITLRKWQEGDWFIPLGMSGKKKISDFLIDNKIAIHLKKNIFLLTSNNHIFWVIKHRPDDRFKITSTTKKVLKIIFFDSLSQNK